MKESRETKSPLDEKVHLPRDVADAARFFSENGPRPLIFFWRRQIEASRTRAREYTRGTEERGASLSREQQMAQGKLDFPLLVQISRGLRTGGKRRIRQFSTGFQIVGSLRGPCAGAEMSPRQLPSNSKWRVEAGRAAAADPQESAFRGDAPGQVDRGRLDGPFPVNEEGELITGRGLKVLNPTSRF